MDCLRNIFTVLLVLLQISISGQEIIISDTVKLKIGIYKNFNEFKFNNPSYKRLLKIDSRIIKAGPLKTEEHISYSIQVDKNEARSIGEIFGYCDGKDIYIGSFSKCDKLLYKGRYCLYNYIEDKYPIVKSIYPYSNCATYIIDINNGVEKMLTQKELGKILSEDTVLLRQYEMEKSAVRMEDNDEEWLYEKNKRIKSISNKYLIKYSDSHLDEIETVLPDVTMDQICEFLLRTEKDTSMELYYDRTKNFTKSIEAIKSIELIRTEYPNGNIKSIGIKAQHEYGSNHDYYYKVGTWLFFFKTGQLKERIDYDMLERKNGLYEYYDKEGNLFESKEFRKNIEINTKK